MQTPEKPQLHAKQNLQNVSLLAEYYNSNEIKINRFWRIEWITTII